MRKCSVCRMSPLSSCGVELCPYEDLSKEEVQQPKQEPASCALRAEGGAVEKEESNLLFNYA